MPRYVEMSVRESNHQYYLKNRKNLIAKSIKSRNQTADDFKLYFNKLMDWGTPSPIAP